MKHLAKRLDRIANELEYKGFKKLAAELDSVANALESHRKPIMVPGHITQEAIPGVLKEWKKP